MLHSSPLGKKTTYSDKYNSNLLHPIARIPQDNKIAMFGYDLWHLYELSWLNSWGMPLVATGNIVYSSDSPNLVESKSLKLYLNSFNNSKFSSAQSIETTIENDLSNILMTKILVRVFDLDSTNSIVRPDGCCIDNLELQIEDFNFDSRLKVLQEMIASEAIVSEKLHSNLLRSNCPITNQPDWGSIAVEYTGRKLSREHLLRYILFYRNHNDFHENCVENIYSELMTWCQPSSLKVYANYTRRGGIDINPYRSSKKDFCLEQVVLVKDRLVRQ